MKQRIIQSALKARQKQIEQAKLLAQNKAQEAFGIAEISNAHALYTNLAYGGILNGKADSEKTAEALKAYRATLKKYGYCESDFEYKPTCPICNDTGNDGGKACKCMHEEYIAMLKQECEIDKKAAFSFDDCNLDCVKDKIQRKALEALYSHMRAYVQKYPNVKTNNITLSGSVGTGKTCLASAMAREAAERGNTVKIFSAYEFNAAMLEAHTSPISERTQKLRDALTADFLLIDDLGTEPTLRNVTVEYLLLTLEERLNRGLCTIITTNLSADGVLNRYGERIYSRLCDKKHSQFFELSGKDLRTSI